MAQILRMDSPDVVSDSKAAKWDQLCRQMTHRGHGDAVKTGEVISYVDVLISKAKCFDDLMDTCREIGMDSGMPNTFIGNLAKIVDDAVKMCQAHGKPNDQTVAAFVNELAENLRSANDEMNDVHEAAGKLGYNSEGVESVADFLDRLDDCEDCGGPLVAFNDCTITINR